MDLKEIDDKSVASMVSQDVVGNNRPGLRRRAMIRTQVDREAPENTGYF
jgi:hypothetical protein